MNSSLIQKFYIQPLRAPLNQPFRTSLGTHDRMENALFVLELADGTRGYGEAGIAPHITGETLAQTMQSLQKVGAQLVGKPVTDYLTIISQWHEGLAANKAALAAVEGALLDALTRQLRIPLWKFFGDRCVKLVSDITIVIADLAETEASVRHYYRRGFRAFKVKIGKDFALDLERVAAVVKLAPRCRLYLDANQGFSAEETLKFLRELKQRLVAQRRRQGLRGGGRASYVHARPAQSLRSFGIELLEQPVPAQDWEGLKKVSRLSEVPVCADESVRSVGEAVRIIREKAAPVINLKLMKTGIIRSREIARLAHAKGIKLMMGGMLESSLAMTTAAHLAAGLGCFDFIDLDTPFFIQKGHDQNPYLSSRGVYSLGKCPAGVGVEPATRLKKIPSKI